MVIKLVREGLGRIIVFLNFITLPKPIQRSEEGQNNVNKQSKKLSLYQFYGCPFCVKVRRALHRLNVSLEFRDVKKEGPFRKDLQQEGGRVKVPCLRIEENSQTQWLYESNVIIEYLDKKFSRIN